MIRGLKKRRWVAVAAAGLVAALTVVASSACGDGGGGDGRLKVVATTSQIGALTREVAGDKVSLTVLLGPGVDAHTFDPDPGDVRRISDADLVLRNGIGLDNFLDDVIGGSSQEKIVTVTEGITLQQGASGEGGDDPHVWHDPENAKKMTFNIAEALAEADPANASYYDEHARAYAAVLDDTDRQIRELIDSIPPENRKIVTNHDSLGYFINRYGLEYVGAIIPSVTSGSQPSAGDIARLEDLIREENVRAIFAEAELDSRVAQQISRDTGVKIVDDLYADSLGPPGSGADTVDGMLLANARKIAEALR
jgi:ABC-type Zn uptake system ZnuABC Zn-binding protein ZnuA